MAFNRSKQDNVEQRREMVSQLRLRMLSMREIAVALERNGIVSPITGRAFDVATIKRDIDALKEEWHQSRNVNTDEHINREFMELQEIKRAGWSSKDPELARKALRDEMDLLGTKKPQELNININITVIVQQIIELAESMDMDASAVFEAALRRLDNAKKLQDANR